MDCPCVEGHWAVPGNSAPGKALKCVVLLLTPTSPGGTGSIPASVGIPKEYLVFLKDGSVIFSSVSVAHFNFDSIWEN